MAGVVETLRGVLCPASSEPVPRVILSTIVFERKETLDQGQLAELSLATLHSLRTGTPFAGRCRITASDMRHELDALPANSLLLDISGEDRDLSQLQTLADQHTHLHFSFSTSPAPFLSDNCDDVLRVGESMKAELVAGIPLGGRYCRASAMAAAVTEPQLSRNDEIALASCAAVHRLGCPAPIIISLPLSPSPCLRLIHSAASLLLAAGADMSRVIFSNLVVTDRNASRLADLMRTHRFFVSIDCMGVSAVSLPTEGESFPSDSDIVAGIELLCSQGLSAQLIVSVYARSKLFLRKFGGPGYDWLEESVVPRLRGSPTASAYVSNLFGANAMKQLGGRIPEVFEEIPPETLPCYVCGKTFVPGDHFTKFDFVYCSSACLNSHRRRNWATESR